MSQKARVRRSASATVKKQPLAFDVALGDLARSIGITRKLREYSVVTSWASLVGEQIARVTVPQRVENGMLFVSVTSAPWRAELTMRRREIIARINASLGKNVIHDIRFR